MAKRCNGEGSIGKYKDGWRSKIMIGTKDDGKPIMKEFYGKKRKDVQTKLDEYKIKLSLGTLPTDDKITVEEWFFTWLFDYRKKDLKPKSFERYEGLYRKYIKDTDLGKTKLKDLKTTHIQKYYNQLIEKGISIQTVSQINTKLKTCLGYAEKQEYIRRNYCTMVTLPKAIKDKKLEVLTLDQQQQFIEYIKGHDLEILFLVALSTGLRIGEIRGLKWSDINFIDSSLCVNRTLQRGYDIDKDGNRKLKIIEQSPKTSNSIRSVPIPKSILSKLKNLKKSQNENKLKSYGQYIDNDYVFCNELGVSINDKKPGRNLTSILKFLNIEPIKFHGLRKTYATRLFENDVPPKTVQELLGHSSIDITMDIYTQVMEYKKVEAVEKLDSIFEL